MTIAAFRPDFARQRDARQETRTLERLAAHYAVEARLAKALAAAGPAERSALYGTLYRELFSSVPDHPQHRGDRAQRQSQIANQAFVLLRELTPQSTYAEIGCGDALLTKAVAKGVICAIGVDVTDELVTEDAPSSFRFMKSDGVTLSIPDGSVDLVYSNQLMEHLHVDDAVGQLREIIRVLKPGGRYVCCTPNRLTGPHDISVYFTEYPTGFHMHEYDHRSLSRLFQAVGFRRVTARLTLKGIQMNLPVTLLAMIEGGIERMPQMLRSALVLQRVVVSLLGLTLVGVK